MEDDTLVRLAYRAVERYQLDDGARTARLEAPQARAHGSVFCDGVSGIGTPDERSVAAGPWVVGALDWGELVAFDPRDGSHAWRAALDLRVAAVAATGSDAIVAAGEAQRATHAAVASVQRADGTLRWRTELPGEAAEVLVQGLLADRGHAWVVALDGLHRPAACAVYGLDAGSGQVRFTRRLPLASDGPAACSLTRDADRLLVGRSTEGYSLLDACDGSVIVERDVPGLVLGPLALRGDTAFVMVRAVAAASRWGADPEPAVLSAVDVLSGVERWRHPVPIWPAGPLLVGPWVVTLTYGRTVVALDRASGSVAWSWAPGDVVHLGLQPPASPRWLLAVTATREVDALDLEHPVQGRPGPPTTIRGRVVWEGEPWASAPRWVRVADQIVAVDARGHFAAQVEGTGRASIEANLTGVAPRRQPRDRCPGGGAEVVPLDGAEHRVELRVVFAACE